MATTAKDKSPIPQLVELYAQLGEIDDRGSADVHVTVLINPDEVEIDEHTLAISFTAAFLNVETHGSRTDPNQKYGLRKHPERSLQISEVEKSTKSTHSATAAIEAVISGENTAVAQSVKASGSRRSEKSAAQEVILSKRETTNTEHLLVEAVGADRWHIKPDRDETKLKGSYISDDKLCKLIKGPTLSNRFGATIALQVKRKDIQVSLVGKKFMSLTPNKDKLLAILVGKKLADIAHDQSCEAITFATSEVDHAG